MKEEMMSDSIDEAMAADDDEEERSVLVARGGATGGWRRPTDCLQPPASLLTRKWMKSGQCLDSGNDNNGQ